jgi:hypothetical protein
MSDDYSKVAFLCADRSVSLHAKFGSYFKLRVPKFGRDLAYDAHGAELLVAGSSCEMRRAVQGRAGRGGAGRLSLLLCRALCTALALRMGVGGGAAGPGCSFELGCNRSHLAHVGCP